MLDDLTQRLLNLEAERRIVRDELHRLRERVQQLDLCIEACRQEIAIEEGTLRSPEPQALAIAVQSVIERIQPIKTRSMSSKKPKELKTVLEMAEEVLSEAERYGRQHLTATEITEQIRAKYWPEADVRLVSPQLWRAAKQQRKLLRVGSSYALMRCSTSKSI